MPEGKKVIFFDELPWMDAPRSGFLAELEAFWNGWASARKRAVFQQVSKTKNAVHLVLVTTQGIAPGINQYSVQACVVLDDLFKEE